MLLNHGLRIDKLHRDLPAIISRLLSSRWEETTSPMVAESLAELAGIGGRYSWKSQSSSPAEVRTKSPWECVASPERRIWERDREENMRRGTPTRSLSLWWRCGRWTVAHRGRTHLRRVITGPTCSVSPAKGVVWSWGDENRLHLNSKLAHCAHIMTLDYCCCYFSYLCVLTRIILLEMSNLVQIDTLKHFFSGGADFSATFDRQILPPSGHPAPLHVRLRETLNNLEFTFLW